MAGREAVEGADLAGIVAALRASPRVGMKKAVRVISDQLSNPVHVGARRVLLGDDAAAIPWGDEYLLVAAEGIWGPLLEANPVVAGRVAVLANVNDIYAMGGRPVALLDVLAASDSEEASAVLRGLRDRSVAYDVPVVGGHYSQAPGARSLSAFIVGRAKTLLSSFTAQEGDRLLLACNLEGRLVTPFTFWDCSSAFEAAVLKRQLEVLPELAESGLCDTAKDVSMGGIVGTLLMMMEASGKGASLALSRVPVPPGVPLLDWLQAYQSYGFLLAVRPRKVEAVVRAFGKEALSCREIGEVDSSRKVTFTLGEERRVFWDLESEPLTGFDDPRISKGEER